MGYPWFERWFVLGKFDDFPIDPKFTKIHQWIANVQERPSIKASRQSDEFYLERYHKYFV